MSEPLTREQVEQALDILHDDSKGRATRGIAHNHLLVTYAALRQQLAPVAREQKDARELRAHISDVEQVLRDHGQYRYEPMDGLSHLSCSVRDVCSDLSSMKQQLATMKKALATLSKLGGGTSTGNDIARYALEEAQP